jgi:hypothetical protein
MAFPGCFIPLSSSQNKGVINTARPQRRTRTSENLTLPVAEYPHTLITHDDNGCSITGGFVYRGPGNPDLQGIYFFGDYCTGRIWGLRQNGPVWQQQELLVTAHNISTFGEDEAGNLYYADRTGGTIHRIEQVGP